MTKILIVDDEQDMRNLIEVMLRQSGFQTIQANGGQEAIQLLIKDQQIDLVILDIMMPEMDGFSVCTEIRRISEVPIIFLTAKDDNEDKVKGLTIGADDYVVKPFSSSELVARMQAVLRRTDKEFVESKQLIIKGPIELDVVSRKVCVNGKVIPLTLKEFEILHLFMNNENVVYTRDQLLGIIWDSQYGGGTRTVDTHIKTLRLKLGAEAGKFIQTVWGLGYRFEVVK